MYEKEVRTILKNRSVYKVLLHKEVRDTDIQGLAEEICQLLSPKPDKNRLLSPKQAVELLTKEECELFKPVLSRLPEYLKRTLEAQRDLIASYYQAQLKEIKEEIEKSMGEDITNYRDGHVAYLTVIKETWQSLQ